MLGASKNAESISRIELAIRSLTMPRKTLIRSDIFPYHVTARNNNRDPFHSPLEHVWNILSSQCFEISLLFGARIHAFLLMPNHIHLLISTPNEDLGIIMKYWMGSGTKALNQNSGRTGHVFGGSYHWSLVNSPVYYGHALKYVYRNPVRAGICELAEDYNYSTLPGILGEQALRFPIHYPFQMLSCVPDDFDDLCIWLNKPFKIEHQSAIQKGLRHSLFQPAKLGWRRTLDQLMVPLL